MGRTKAGTGHVDPSTPYQAPRLHAAHRGVNCKFNRPCWKINDEIEGIKLSCALKLSPNLGRRLDFSIRPS